MKARAPSFASSGRAIGVNWLLDKGLEAGERVVIDGFQRIKPGDKVTVVETPANAQSQPQPVDSQAAAARLRAAVATGK